MRKLKLVVADLQVASFESEPPVDPRGTVAGYNPTGAGQDTCPTGAGQNTCDSHAYTCGQPYTGCAICTGNSGVYTCIPCGTVTCTCPAE